MRQAKNVVWTALAALAGVVGVVGLLLVSLVVQLAPLALAVWLVVWLLRALKVIP